MPCDEVQRKLVAFADDRLSAPGAVLEEGGDMLQPWQSPPSGAGDGDSGSLVPDAGSLCYNDEERAERDSYFLIQL